MTNREDQRRSMRGFKTAHGNKRGWAKLCRPGEASKVEMTDFEGFAGESAPEPKVGMPGNSPTKSANSATVFG